MLRPLGLLLLRLMRPPVSKVVPLRTKTVPRTIRSPQDKAYQHLVYKVAALTEELIRLQKKVEALGAELIRIDRGS